MIPGGYASGNGLQSGSPVKEASYLNRETSAEELEGKENEVEGVKKMDGMSPPPAKEGIPIRR